LPSTGETGIKVGCSSGLQISVMYQPNLPFKEEIPNDKNCNGILNKNGNGKGEMCVSGGNPIILS